MYVGLKCVLCLCRKPSYWLAFEREGETEGRRAGTKKGQSREVKGKSTFVVRCGYAFCCCFAGYTKQRRAKRNATHVLCWMDFNPVGKYCVLTWA